jgi:predicted dinucleotide-binding enzyme
MRIALFGTGPVGRALAGGLLNRGHSVAMGTRAPDDPAVVARLADLPGVSVMAHREAAKTAELAIFAIPFDGLSAVAGEITDALPPPRDYPDRRLRSRTAWTRRTAGARDRPRRLRG